MIPIYIVYLAGSSSADDVKKKRLIINAAGFVIGFTIVFVVLGVIASMIGSIQSNFREILRIASGIIMIIFGINFTGLFKIGIFNKEKRINYEIRNFGFFTSIIFGLIFAFGWTPCIGPLLGIALVKAASSGTIQQGILLLLLYSMGLGIPFMLTAIIYDLIKNTLKNMQKYSKQISIGSGIFLIIAGLLVLLDYMKYLS